MEGFPGPTCGRCEKYMCGNTSFHVGAESTNSQVFVYLSRKNPLSINSLRPNCHSFCSHVSLMEVFKNRFHLGFVDRIPLYFASIVRLFRPGTTAQPVTLSFFPCTPEDTFRGVM